MPEEQTHMLDDIVRHINMVRRKDLLPWWIKLFSWFFLVFGALGIVGIVFGILGWQFSMSIFGLKTSEPFSVEGIIIITIFLFKCAVSYGLLWEKKWAVMLGIVDAIFGMLICIVMAFYSSYTLDLILLIPYLIKMLMIRSRWEQAEQIT